MLENITCLDKYGPGYYHDHIVIIIIIVLIVIVVLVTMIVVVVADCCPAKDNVCCVGLLIAIFQHCPPLQSTLMDDVLTQVLPCVPVGKRCPGAYLVGDEKSASIQVLVAMLVQMIQVRMQSQCLHLAGCQCLLSLASPAANEAQQKHNVQFSTLHSRHHLLISFLECFEHKICLRLEVVH